MSVYREIQCRECGQCFEHWCSASELPVQCECGSKDTYSVIGTGTFMLKGSCWAWTGYDRTPGVKHINATPTYEDRQEARREIKRHEERVVEAERAGLKSWKDMT